MPYADREDRNIALVVDDSPETLGMVTTALEENGISVVVARSGAGALDLAKRILPDVVLMDAVMPQMDGFETCRLLKSDDRLAYAPVIFMTGLTESEHIIKGLLSGGVDYLTKPVVVDELVARIMTHILNARAIQSARQALDASGRSVVAVNPQGAVLWGSPRALRIVGPLDADGMIAAEVPESFTGWIERCLSLPASQTAPFAFDQSKVSFIGKSPSNEILLNVCSGNRQSPYKLLAASFKLTPREAEVLFWLSMGKTNRDIAQILSLSSRTINKHLEQIFQKMGVDNRTSAAVSADRAINQAGL